MLPCFAYNPFLQIAKLLISLTQSGQQSLIQTRKVLFDLSGNGTGVPETEATQHVSNQGNGKDRQQQHPPHLRAARFSCSNFLLQQPRAPCPKESDYRQQSPKPHASQAFRHRPNSIQQCLVHLFNPSSFSTHCRNHRPPVPTVLCISQLLPRLDRRHTIGPPSTAPERSQQRLQPQ